MEDERLLREMLFEEHSCFLKYGDDGERQCGECVIDFIRMSPAEIRDRLDVRNKKRLVDHCRQLEARDAQERDPAVDDLGEVLASLKDVYAHAEDMTCELEKTDDTSEYPYLVKARQVIAKYMEAGNA